MRINKEVSPFISIWPLALKAAATAHSGSKWLKSAQNKFTWCHLFKASFVNSQLFFVSGRTFERTSYSKFVKLLQA